MILILTQCFPPVIGGIENLMGGAAANLSARGHDVVVLADGKRSHAGVQPEGSFAVTYFRGWKPLRRLRKRRAIKQLVRRHKIEAVLADSWKSVETLVNSGEAENVGPVVCYAHGNEFPRTVTQSKVKRIRKALSSASKVIANSSFTAERVTQYVNHPDVEVRSPAIDVPLGPSPEAEGWADKHWGDAAFKMLSVSRLEPLKGIDNALRAIKLLLPKQPRLRYIVAGAGDDRARLEELVSSLELGANVQFVGPVEGHKKAALYSSADLFVMPTRPIGERQETFGMVYLEAAAYGVPVVGGLAGGAKEAVQDGKTGILVDGTDVDGIVAVIGNLLDDASVRRQMATAAKAFSARFTWPEQAGLLEQDLGVSVVDNHT